MERSKKIPAVWHTIIRFFNTRNMAILLAGVLLLALIPMFAVGVYAHSFADDYAYGKPAHEAWMATGSVPAVLKGAAEGAASRWVSWQGTFSAIFLMGLEPGLFGESCYYLGALFQLAAFLAASAFFFWVTLKKTLRMDVWSRLLVGSVCTLLATQFMPSAADAFYWYNGSIYYTFFFSVSLVWASLILLRTLHSMRGVIPLILILLLSVFIGGGNYATVLLCIVLLFALLLWQFLMKRRDWGLVAAFALILAAFLISYFAPGTAVRAATCEVAGFPRAVALTFLYTGNFFSEKLTLPILLAVLFAAPALARNAARSEWRFRFPLLITLGSFALIYIGLFSPIYAMSGGVPLRLENVVFYMCVILLFVNEYYWLGWLIRRLRGTGAGERLRYCVGYFYLALGILTVLSLCTLNTTKATSVRAGLDLLNGSAAQYDREMDERIAIVTDSPDADVVLPPLSVYPETICAGDLRSDPGHWINVLFARYFGKNSVRVG